MSHRDMVGLPASEGPGGLTAGTVGRAYGPTSRVGLDASAQRSPTEHACKGVQAGRRFAPTGRLPGFNPRRRLPFGVRMSQASASG